MNSSVQFVESSVQTFTNYEESSPRSKSRWHVLKAHVTISSGPAVQRTSSHPLPTVLVDFGFADLNKVALGFHHLTKTG